MTTAEAALQSSPEQTLARACFPAPRSTYEHRARQQGSQDPHYSMSSREGYFPPFCRAVNGRRPARCFHESRFIRTPDSGLGLSSVICSWLDSFAHSNSRHSASTRIPPKPPPPPKPLLHSEPQGLACPLLSSRKLIRDQTNDWCQRSQPLSWLRRKLAAGLDCKSSDSVW